MDFQIVDARKGIYPACAPSHGCPPDHTHFRLKGKTSPTAPREGEAPFGIPGSTHPTQSCSLSWLHSTGPLVWGGINATLLNVSWSGTAQTKGQECCVMAGHPRRTTTKPLQPRSCRNVLLGRRRGEGGPAHSDGKFENVSKHMALPCSLCFQKLECEIP